MIDKTIKKLRQENKKHIIFELLFLVKDVFITDINIEEELFL